MQSLRVKVPAGESLRSLFDVNVNELIPECGTLGFKVVFKAENGGNAFSDAMFVPVSVYPDTQRLTEAHSAVLLAGADQDALISRLRKMFVNADGDNAEVKVLSILDMVRDAVPSKVEPAGNDVLTLSAALYVRRSALTNIFEEDAGLPQCGWRFRMVRGDVFVSCHNGCAAGAVREDA